MYGHKQNTNISWADAAHLVFQLHTYHTYLQYQHGEYVSTRGEQQQKISLSLPSSNNKLRTQQHS
jgi:hypothetical protein